MTLKDMTVRMIPDNDWKQLTNDIKRIQPDEDKIARNIAERLQSVINQEIHDALEKSLSERSQSASPMALSAPSTDDGEAAELKEALEEQRKRLTQEKNKVLEDERERLTREKEEALEEQRERLTREKEEVLKAKQDEIDALTNDNADLKTQLEPFTGLLDIYNRYSALELVKANGEWREILPADTPTRFLLRGSQGNTITAFWKKLRDYCERPGMTDNPDWTVLLEVLSFLLEAYDSLWDAPVLEWMNDRAGDRFDEDRHTRAKSGSQHSGNIAEVLLPGIWNVKEKKAAQKCVVVVGEEGGLS